jgi:formate dehydrogenase iron-sulfur subunit
MPVDRREFLKIAGAGLGGLLLPISSASASSDPVNAENAFSMLYDAPKCVGCRACQTACKERAQLSPVKDAENLYEAPMELNSENWTLIKLYNGEDGSSFVKNQCMLCLEPACVSVCPVGALQKTPEGPVVYHADRCIGCRYCMTACPFDVPKYQWEEVRPLIQKCDFCADLQAEGKQPACGAACPTGALISGKRGEMLEIAHRRINEKPDFYESKVYGEKEVGGTSMLYLAKLPYEKLGLPALNESAIPEITWPYMKSVPYVFFGMGGIMTAIYYFTHRNDKKEEA